ncbi:hypothetical protein [Acidovorax sp. SUPP3334]|uniref:hypothetical protein n=1 Tax=Acidovorax sp. SUPP3334 TaxID=2920881 RepID=UPI0024E16F47|nr:hypothetical protein [Acidovorax sp. SUPP3334]
MLVLMATRATKSTASPAARKTKAAAKPVVPKKEAGGRPSKYTPKFHDPLARRLTLLGQTMAQMADVFDVAESTIWDWKKKHPRFSEAITCARANADALVAEFLFNIDVGQKVTETRTRTIVSKTGEEVVEKPSS